MADVSIGSGGIIPVGSSPATTSQSVFIGQVLIATSADTVGTSVATTAALATTWSGYLAPIGIAVTSAPNGARVFYQQPGTTVELSTAAWDGVTGQVGGLTPGAFYYMSTTVSGAMTRVNPIGGGGGKLIIGIGTAKSTTELQLQPGGSGPRHRSI